MASHNLPQTSATLRYSRLPAFTPRTQYQWIAVLIWLMGAGATALLLQGVGLPVTVAAGAAVLVQWIFTKLERPMWRRRWNVVSLLFVIFDVLINAGGLFTLVQRLDQTQVWTMLQAFGAVGSQMGPVGAGVIAFGFGFAIAWSPEAIWNW